MRFALILLIAVCVLSSPLLALAGETGVWSLDTSKMGPRELSRLEEDPRIIDWVEMGDRLLAATGPAEAAELRREGLKLSKVAGLEDLRGLHLVFSKHHGVASLLEGQVELAVKVGPFFLIRARPPELLRLRQHEDHRLEIVPLASRSVVFRSPSHLAEVPPADPAVTPFVARVNRGSYTSKLEKLIAFETRYSYSPKVVQAAEWARDTLASYGLEARIEMFSRGGRQMPNVVAELKGTSRAGEIYILGAHLDSISWDSASSAPGADDNASGSAAVLEMARVLATGTSEATIRFVLFSGEEQGLLGSRAYVARLREVGELPKVKAMINLDMIAFDQSAPLQVMLEGRVISHGLSDRLQAHAQAHSPELAVNRTDNAWGSDHVPFLDAKVPTTLTIEFEYDDNSNEHSPRDVIGICNIDLAMAILKMDVGALAELAGARP